MSSIPMNEEAERGVLGSILIEPDVIERVRMTGLKSSDFYDRRNILIFETIESMMVDGIPVDSISLRTRLMETGEHDKAGGDAYIGELYGDTAVAAHSGHYAKLVRDASTRRHMVQCAQELVDAASSGGETACHIEELQRCGTDSFQSRDKKAVIKEAKQMTKDILEGKDPCIPTPFFSFNIKTKGIPRGIVCPLAGRGGKGKSMLKAFMSSKFVSRGVPVLDFCFEDSDTRTAMRIAASLGRYDLFRLRRNAPDDFVKKHLECLGQIECLPYYPHQSACSVEDIGIHISKFVRENEPDIRQHGGVVWIDGIKDVIPSGGENKTSQEEHISAALSRYAVTHRDVTIIPITHLTKLDTDTRITLNNIRGSALQVANGRAAMLFHDAGFTSEEMREYGGVPDEDMMVLEMAKTNYGSEGHAVLKKHFQTGEFHELTEEYE